MSTADVGQFTTLRQFRTEEDVKFDYIEDSLKAIFTQRELEGSLIIPSTTSLTINGYKVTIDASAGIGTKSRMVELDTAVVGRRATRTRQFFIGNRGAISPVWFGLGSETDFQPGGDVLVTGDVYLGGDYKSGGNQVKISRDLYGPRSSLTETPTVSGALRLGRRSTVAVLDSNAYAAAASNKTSGTQSCNSLSFSAIGAFQSLWYNDGNVTFDVQYSGRGTVFVKGNVFIKNFARNSSTDQGLIIVDGNVTLQTNNLSGYLICNGIVSRSGGSDLTVEGGIWANKFNLGNQELTVVEDSFFWNSPAWDKRMRVPGMW
ncbi:MAG: hypothetical protein WCK51_07140 [Armatimonadota bacterium]